MKSALTWIGIVAYPSAVIIGFVLCASQISVCKEHHKKEKQAEAQRYLTAYLSSIGQKKSSEKPKGEATNPEPPNQCGDTCSILAKTLEDPVAFFTLLLSVVVWLQFGWMIRQEGYLDKSISVAEKAANAASRQARIAVASKLPVIAFVGQKLIGYDEQGKAIQKLDPIAHGPLPNNMMRALVCVQNVGKGYAALLRWSIRWKVAPELPPGPPEPIYGHMAVGNLLIGEDDSTWIVYEREPIVLSDAERAAINSNQTHLWIFGFLAYGDILEDMHTIGFCYRWEIRPDIGDQPRGLIPDGPPRYRYQKHHQKKEEGDE